MTEYQNLLARKAELDAQIAQAQAEAKAQAVAQARALIVEHGLTAADVFPQGKAKGSVGTPKYRDPGRSGSRAILMRPLPSDARSWDSLFSISSMANLGRNAVTTACKNSPETDRITPSLSSVA